MFAMMATLLMIGCQVDAYAVANRFAPVEQAWQAPTHPETDKARRARYRDIARDVCAVTMTSPPPRGFTRAQAVRLVMAMAVGESALAADADLGPCYRKGQYRSRCDGGRSVGILQVMAPKRDRARLFGDRVELVRRAHKGLRASFGMCTRRPMPERLALYASGSCDNEAGLRASRRRWRLVARVMAWSAPSEGET